MQAAGKVALVTGAARRVGKAIALALADRGAHVVITYNTSGAEAFSTLQEIETRGVRGIAHVHGPFTSSRPCSSGVSSTSAARRLTSNRWRT